MADSMLSLLFPACELHLLFAQNLLSLRAGALLLFRRMLLSCMYHLASVSSFSLHHPCTRRAYNSGHCKDSQFRMQTLVLLIMKMAAHLSNIHANICLFQHAYHNNICIHMMSS